MRLNDLKAHLRPYSIVQRRKTTINHAFASALAPSDAYDQHRLAKAMLASYLAFLAADFDVTAGLLDGYEARSPVVRTGARGREGARGDPAISAGFLAG